MAEFSTPSMPTKEVIENLKTMVFGAQAFERFNAKERETLSEAWQMLENRKPHWIATDYRNATHYVCSECGEFWDITGDAFKYCPTCGAGPMEVRY